MNTQSSHILAEFHGCDPSLLNSVEDIRQAMLEAAIAAQATVVAESFHRYAPQGVSGVLVLAESHLSVHTWPEAGYAATDIFTCGTCLPQRAQDVLGRALAAQSVELMELRRGEKAPGIRVVRHQSPVRVEKPVSPRQQNPSARP